MLKDADYLLHKIIPGSSATFLYSLSRNFRCSSVVVSKEKGKFWSLRPRPAPRGPAHITHHTSHSGTPHPTPASRFPPLVHTPNSRIPHPHPPASPRPSCGSTSPTPHPAPPARLLRAVGVRVWDLNAGCRFHAGCVLPSRSGPRCRGGGSGALAGGYK